MLKHLLIVLAAISLPLPALAGNTQTAPASSLGPQTTTPAGGSSTASGGALQPAGTAPLQSSVKQGSGLSAPASTLQGSVPTEEALRVLGAETEGPPRPLPETPGVSPWWLSLIAVFIVLGAIVVLRDRRRFQDPPL